MTNAQHCRSVPGPVDDVARHFDPLFATVNQPRSFRAYLQGLLLPRDRNKTLTALAGTEPVVGAQEAPAQHLQFFLSEAAWDVAAGNRRRLELLLSDEATMLHDQGC